MRDRGGEECVYRVTREIEDESRRHGEAILGSFEKWWRGERMVARGEAPAKCIWLIDLA